MKRKKKILICIIGMVMGACIVLGAGFYAKFQSAGRGPGNQQMGKAPDMKNSGESDSQQGTQEGTPPKLPDQKSDTSSDKMKPGNAPRGGILGMKYMILIGIGTFLFSTSILYLLMSRLTQRAVLSGAGKSVLFLIISLVLTAGLTFGSSYGLSHFVLKRGEAQSQPKQDAQKSSVSASAVKVIENEEESDSDVSSTGSDESAVLVKSGGSAVLSGSTISKTGDTTNTENSEFYGINAAFLTQSNSTSTLSNLKIKTDSKGSNAVFATGTGAKTKIQNSVIQTKSNSSRGLDATYGGSIEGKKLTITTQGSSSASLATDRGEGTVNVEDSKLETNGSGSPVIYSTGKITLKNSSGTANHSQMVVIEGKNSVSLDHTELSASGKGNRNSVDHAGIMIYQSMSGDASVGTGTFTAKNSTLSIDADSSLYGKAPFFFITNTDAKINLTNNQVSYGSGTLMSVKGTSEWGTSGKNGGNVTLNANKQKLSGSITVDKLSTVTMNLKNNSSYKGAINKSNTAKKITLKLDDTSKLTLTGDSYVNELDTSDETYYNIDFNGYKLYVDGKAVN